jgi:hypothetical protein
VIREGADFSQALQELRRGKHVTRAAWPHGQWLALQGAVREALPYIYQQTAQGRVPWTAGQLDLLAADWRVMEPI